MSERPVRILGPDGLPAVMRKSARGVPRPFSLAGGRGYYGGPAYDAADVYGQHMSEWQPALGSADSELNPFRDRIVARVRDMVRNDGWASGSVTRILDNVIGATLRPIPKPDYRYLAMYSGNTAFDHEWSKDFSEAIDAGWRSWATDELGLYCDASRNQSFVQMMRVGFRHKLVDGDALAIVMWLKDRVGSGRARYATAMQLIDPDRLSNPNGNSDTATIRGGVEIDAAGAAVAFHIRRAHQSDWYTDINSLRWDRIPRETTWGRPIIVHDFDCERAGTHRGGAGIFAPVLQRLKMLVKYDGVELDAAIINSIFAAFVESPYDQQIAEALDANEESLTRFQNARMIYSDDHPIVVGDARIPALFPGEKIGTVAATRPGSNFADFENAVLRNVASGLGLSAQQVSNDWSQVNYSSARGALLEAWKTLDRRRGDFAAGFATPIRAAWMEEAMETDDIPLPKGAPPFIECRQAYSRCRWMGPGRGWVDPVAEKQGAVMGMDAALSTLEDECAAQGLDWVEVLEQRSYELATFDEYGIPRPTWAGLFTATTPDEAKQERMPPPAPTNGKGNGTAKPVRKPTKPTKAP